MAALDNVIDRAVSVFLAVARPQILNNKYLRDMFDLSADSTLAESRLRGFLRKYRSCFSWADVVVHAVDVFM